MQNKNIPANRELPSISQLIKSTILAIVVAALILVTIVLPAEYGIDPTGIGNAIGLLKMGEIKVSLAGEAAEDRAKAETNNATVVEEEPLASDAKTDTIATVATTRSDEMSITLEPNQGREIKLTMAKGSTVEFVWFTDSGKANFDIHGDAKALDISYHGYKKGSLVRDEGELEAAFDGNHGWFWRNRTSQTMKVTLQVKGHYTEIKEMI